MFISATGCHKIDPIVLCRMFSQVLLKNIVFNYTYNLLYIYNIYVKRKCIKKYFFSLKLEIQNILYFESIDKI